MYDLQGIWDKAEMLGVVNDCIVSWSDVAVALTAFMQTFHVSVMVRDDADVDDGMDIVSWMQ